MSENGPDRTRKRNESFSQTVRRRTVLGATAVGIGGLLSTTSADETNPEDFTAARDGDWSDSGTWEGGSPPSSWATVSIPEDVRVTVASELTTAVKRVEVAGTLRHDTSVDSTLRAETIETLPGSRYEIGTDATPVDPDVEATVEFVDDGPIDESTWPERENKGLLAHGELEIAGAEKTAWTALAGHANAGDTSVELPVAPTNWRPGDRIVFPGLDPYDSTTLDHEDEEREITSVDGTEVTFDDPLAYDHEPPSSSSSELDSYVLNLTRNVEFASENAAELRRGHVMVMSTGTDVRHARFRDLGRTNKAQYLTNPVRGEDSLPSQDDPNPAARYPFHYHHTGIDAEPHHAEGLVIEGAPGWGFVNHHAHAEVADSITYDVLGSGFVAEGGNERGSFERCFALRSTGSGDPIDSRAHGAHGGDPEIDDFGHAGHGFWLQSPLVEVVDNVAAGHRHQGFVWWLRPLLDGDLAEGTTVEDSRVTTWPNLPMEYVDEERHAPLLDAIEHGRFSGRDDLLRETGKVPSTFVALENVTGNTAFGAAGGADVSRLNFKWKHERFSDFSVVDDMTVYNVGPFVDADGEVHEPDLPRHRAAGHQGRGGSIGVSFRYASNVSLKRSRLIGIGRAHSVGVPFHDYLWTITVDDCTIAGWDWGVDTGEHRLDWLRNNELRDNEYDVNWSFDNVAPAILENNELDLIRNDFEKNNQKAAEVFGFGRDYGLRIDGRSAYVEESAADHVPFPDQDALDGINNIESTLPAVDDETNLVGLSNAELQEQYGISIGGTLHPDDAVSEPWIEGALVDPADGRTPPTSVHLDAADADVLGGFEAIDEPDAAGDRALRCTGDDDPASISFECDDGTYTIHARVWPAAWNGDDVSFRIDGGQWYQAEKLKTPVGFRWHGVAPNGGEEYEWELSAGTHELAFASTDEDLRIDELFVASDASVLGAYGESTSEQDPPANAAPTATDDSASVERGHAVTIDVCSNDHDPDGSIGRATVSVEDEPAHGTANVYHGGRIRYTHDGSASTADSFTYSVADDDGVRSAPGTVSLSIEAPSDPADSPNDSPASGNDGTNGGGGGGQRTGGSGGPSSGENSVPQSPTESPPSADPPTSAPEPGGGSNGPSAPGEPSGTGETPLSNILSDDADSTDVGGVGGLLGRVLSILRRLF